MVLIIKKKTKWVGSLCSEVNHSGVLEHMKCPKQHDFGKHINEPASLEETTNEVQVEA
jgi:hypothetical protein